MFKRLTPAEQARRVLDACWDGYLPVNLQAIASALSLDVVHDPELCDQGFSGAYEGPESGVVRINPFDSPLRRRFTLAHEIGHHSMGHGARPRDPAANFSVGDADPVEREANQFAAELLMPAEAVRQLVRMDKVRDVRELAKRFSVSEVAMHYRLKNLRLI